MWYKSPLNLVYFISFVDLFAIGLTYPFIGTHLRSLGYSHSFIGAISSLYAGLQVVSGPIIGGLTDIKDRRWVLKKVLLTCGLCYGALGFTNNFFILVIVRIILGIVKHIQSICKAVITDIVPHNKHTEAFGKSAALSSVGFILGPFLGGQISEIPNGFTYVCSLTMILYLANIAVVSKLPEPLNKIKKDDNNDTHRDQNENSGILLGLKRELRKTNEDFKSVNWQKYWEPFLIRALFGLTLSTYFVNQSMLLKEKYQLSQKHSGYIISYYSIIGTCSAYFIGKINKFYETNDCLTRMLHFFSVLATCVFAIFISPNIYVYLIVLVPFALGSSVLRIVSMEFILQKTSGDHRGSLSGASNSIMSISRFISPLLSGVLGDKFGEESVILVSVVPALAGVILCWHLRVN